VSNSLELYNEDSLEYYENIEQDSVDLILTDPPYGTVKGADLDGWNKKSTEWDNRVEAEKIIDIAKHCLRQNGRLITFAQETYSSELVNAADSIIDFNYKAIWLKNNHANPLMSNKALLNLTEDILVFTKKPSDANHVDNHSLKKYSAQLYHYIENNNPEVTSRTSINEVLDHRRAEHFFYESSQFSLCTEETYNELIEEFNIDNFDGFKEYDELEQIDEEEKEKYLNKHDTTYNLPDGKKSVSNVFEYQKPTSSYHPTQKPVDLLSELIRIYSNKRDTVLDPFAGSGSTGVACKEEGREFVGIEKKEEYYETMLDRLES